MADIFLSSRCTLTSLHLDIGTLAVEPLILLAARCQTLRNLTLGFGSYVGLDAREVAAKMRDASPELQIHGLEIDEPKFSSSKQEEKKATLSKHRLLRENHQKRRT